MPRRALSYEQVVDLVRRDDVERLSEAFSLAATWEDREIVIVAFEQVHRTTNPAVLGRLRDVMPDVIALCRAESRSNAVAEGCLETAERILRRIRRAT